MGICESCGTALPARAKTGRPRRYCSPRCRDEAWRRRQVVDDWVTLEPLEPRAGNGRREDLVAAAEAILDAEPIKPPEERLTSAVLESALLAHEFADVAGRVPRGLAWRATGMSDEIQTALRRYFPPVEHETREGTPDEL